jgi:hypothetical protein
MQANSSAMGWLGLEGLILVSRQALRRPRRSSLEATIVNTALIGAVFMLSVWRTGSALPASVAHFEVDYLDFTGFWSKPRLV